MKKHNIFKVVSITLLVAVLLTWVLESTYYSGEVVNNGKLQVGIFDLFSYFSAILSYFGYIPLYIFTSSQFNNFS